MRGGKLCDFVIHFPALAAFRPGFLNGELDEPADPRIQDFHLAFMLGPGAGALSQDFIVLGDSAIMVFQPLWVHFQPLFVILGDYAQLNKPPVARGARAGVSCCTWPQ